MRATSVVGWGLGSKKRASCLISLLTIVQRQLETVKLKSEKEHLLFLTLPDLHKGTDGGTKSNVFFGKVSKEGGGSFSIQKIVLLILDLYTGL